MTGGAEMKRIIVGAREHRRARIDDRRLCLRILVPDREYSLERSSRNRTSLTMLRPKMAHFDFAYNFDMCQPIFTIVGRHILQKFATSGYVTNPPYAVCVAALPCKILVTTSVVFGPRVGFGAHVCYHCRISPPRFLAECL